jgi:hypothetical protein
MSRVSNNRSSSRLIINKAPQKQPKQHKGTTPTNKGGHHGRPVVINPAPVSTGPIKPVINPAPSKPTKLPPAVVTNTFVNADDNKGPKKS